MARAKRCAGSMQMKESWQLLTATRLMGSRLKDCVHEPEPRASKFVKSKCYTQISSGVSCRDEGRASEMCECVLYSYLTRKPRPTFRLIPMPRDLERLIAAAQVVPLVRC